MKTIERKILLVSHNPIGEQDNMGRTMKNIFGYFSSDEICQIYLRDQNPDFDVCDQYFYIDESRVAKSILNTKIKTGQVISRENKKKSMQLEYGVHESALKNKIYILGSRKTQLIYLLRNWIWDRGYWFSKELVEWLEIQKPTCVFFMAGDCSFSMKMAMKLADYCKVPLFSYYVDEYYFYKPISQHIPVEAHKYQEVFKQLFEKSEMNFCISEMMKYKYEHEFGKPTEILMNVADLIDQESPNFKNKEIYMCYMGNISLGRWKTLSVLSSVVKKINTQKEYKINFEIYSGEKDNTILKALLKNKDVNFGGEISADKVQEKMRCADILVHTESFEKKFINLVKYSISTKIPELLGSGKVLLAVGPEEVESINYLKRNNAALIVDNMDNMEQILVDCIEKKKYLEILENQKLLLRKNHDKIKNYRQLETYLLTD